MITTAACPMEAQIPSIILWYKGGVPRKYIHFPDYAVGRIFLQKVGGI